jgi:hypothetical protein
MKRRRRIRLSKEARGWRLSARLFLLLPWRAGEGILEPHD